MKRKNLLVFILAFVVITVFGVVFNNLIENEKQRIADEKENIINIVKHLGVKTLEEDNPRSFLKEDGTEIISRLQGYDNEGKLVATIYVGKTKGYKDDLHVGYAIDVETDKVVGVKLLENNETPRFIEALFINDFIDQFKDKALSSKEMKVEAISGATPNSGDHGVIAPATTSGMDKILKLVRKQYAKDTDFEMPAMLEFKSSAQDYDTLNFVYVFNDEGTDVTLVVNHNYELVSITNPAVQDDAIAIAKTKKIKNFISSIEGNTITIKSDGINETSDITSTAVLNDDNEIVSFTSDISQQTPAYVGDKNFGPVYDAIINNGSLPAVSGATVTRDGIWAARNVLYAYLEVLNNE